MPGQLDESNPASIQIQSHSCSKEVFLSHYAILVCLSWLRCFFSGIADRLVLGIGRQRFALSIENQVKAIAKETLNQIKTVMESIKTHDLSREATTAVASFIQRELVFFQNLLGEAVKETELFINACSGHVAFTPDLFNLALSLGSHRAPPKWLVKSATDVSLGGWLADVGKQVNALDGYLSTSPLDPCSYCLGAFPHPQAFLACVLMDHARATMKSVYALEFSVEVITHCNKVSDTSPPPPHPHSSLDNSTARAL